MAYIFGGFMDKKIQSLKYRKIKEAIHPVLKKVLSSMTNGELRVSGILPQDENFMIVGNHLCIEDIPTLAQAVDKHFYLLVSDEDKKTLSGVGLELNGVVWIHRTDKENRIRASQDVVEILKQGEIFAMYPEATWNLSPNLLMLPMNYGCVRMALESHTPIVPIVSFFTDTERHTVIGEKIYPTEDLLASIEEVRDAMATIVYNQIQDNYKRNKDKAGVYSMMIDGEEYFYEKRSEIPENYWINHFNELYNAYDRAKNDKSGVREFESSFIFTPNNDSYNYFQVFNSVIREVDSKLQIKRISSEYNGYAGTGWDEDDYQENFGYGYNEKVLKRELKK